MSRCPAKLQSVTGKWQLRAYGVERSEPHLHSLRRKKALPPLHSSCEAR